MAQQFLYVAALSVLCASPAAAQTAPAGASAYDAAQQARLRADVGTWQCVTDPPSPAAEGFTETEQGNWFVSHAGGALPRTSYERWSHALQAYVLISLFDSGASDVSQSTSSDPDNGVWTPMWPPLDNQGRKRFDIHVSRTGNVLRSKAQFFDEQGKVRFATTTCTKQ